MNSKLVVIIAAVAAVTMSVFAEPSPGSAVPQADKVEIPSEAKNLTPGEQLRYVTGGFVNDKREAIGKIVLFTAQNRVSDTNLFIVASSLEVNTRIMFSLHRIPSFSLDKAEVLMKENKANVGVFLIEDDKFPIAFSVFPELKCSVVNVAILARDNPPLAKILDRASKEIIRGFCMAMGVGYSKTAKGAMQKLDNVKDLDDMLYNGFPLETLTAIQRQAPAFGISLARRAFYRNAVWEGWAPPPADKAQRYVFDRVMSGKDPFPPGIKKEAIVPGAPASKVKKADDAEAAKKFKNDFPDFAK